MHCIDKDGACVRRRAVLGSLAVLTALAAACASKAPAPAPAPAPEPVPAARPPASQAPRGSAPVPAEVPAPAPAAPVLNLGPKVNLPPAPAARNWNEFKRQAAQRMMAASPKAVYAGKPPPMLFGIPILEIEVNADGSVRNIVVTRPPANSDAADTVDYAMEAIRRAAPYGDVSKLPKPWKWTEVFLFNDKRLFKPRTLD